VQETETDSSLDDDDEQQPAKVVRPTTTWYAGESDEERPVKILSPLTVAKFSSEQHQVTNSDDDDDLPLVQVSRGLQSKVRTADEDEDEDKPLSSVLKKMKVSGSANALSPIRKEGEDDDDDEVPLAMRRLTTISNFKAVNQDDDDNRPLGLKVQNTWPNQQMMPQFAPTFPAMSMGAPSVMGVPMPFMQPQVIPSMYYNVSPPQESGPNNFGKIDAWRRAVE
jgi:hypothetical protein